MNGFLVAVKASTLLPVHLASTKVEAVAYARGLTEDCPDANLWHGLRSYQVEDVTIIEYREGKPVSEEEVASPLTADMANA